MIRFALRLVRAYWRWLAIVSVTMLVETLTSLAAPWPDPLPSTPRPLTTWPRCAAPTCCWGSTRPHVERAMHEELVRRGGLSADLVAARP